MERKHSTFTKLLSLVLVFAMLVEFLPANVFAAPEDEAFDPVEQQEELLYEDAEEYIEDYTADTAGNDSEEELAQAIAGELTELREENTKHFRLEDGSNLAVSYGSQIHYKDENNEWTDIDNTLTLKKNTILQKSNFKNATGANAKKADVYEAVNGEQVRQFAAAIDKTGFLFSAKSGESSFSLFVENINENKDVDNGLKRLVPEILLEDQQNTEAELTEEPQDAEAELTEEPQDAEAELSENPQDTEAEQSEDPQDAEAEQSEDPQDAEAEQSEDPQDTEAEQSEKPQDAEVESTKDLQKAEEKEKALDVPETEQALDSNGFNKDIIREKAPVQANIFYPMARFAKMSEEEKRELPISEQVEPEKLSATITYKNVWPGTDIVYQPYGMNVKESIILTQPQSGYTYAFRFQLEGFTASLEEDGSISMVNAAGETVFEIPAPYMEDSDGAYSDNVKYSLAEDENDLILSVWADPDWINDANRAWPITIDPTVVLRSNSSEKNILTSYVNSVNNTSTSYENKKYLRSGYYWRNDYDPNCKGFTVGLIYINTLPSVPADCIVTGSYLEFSQVLFGGMENVNYHRIYATAISNPTTPESYLNNMTWQYYNNNIKDHYAIPSGSTEPAALDYATEYGRPYQDKRMYYDISSAAQKWYTGQTDISRLLVLDDDNHRAGNETDARVTYAGYDYGATVYEPKMYVVYRDTTGLEDVYSYHTQSVGRAGSGYVNDFTLNLTFTVPLITAPSDALPFALNLIYNSSISNTQFTGNGSTIQSLNYSNARVGCGWKTSVQQTVKSVSIKNGSSMKTHLVYVDSDGTEHYFLPKEGSSTVYEDEDGLGLKITASTNPATTNPAVYTMKDKSGNTWFFSYGYLTEYTSSEGNKLYYAYDDVDYPSSNPDWKPTNNSSAHRVTSVWRQNKGASVYNVVARLHYVGSHLSSVTDAANRPTTFGYSDTNATALDTIGFPDGKVMKYSHTTQTGTGRHLLTTVIDYESKTAMKYAYRNGQSAVSKITEYATNGNDLNHESNWEKGAQINAWKQNATYSRYRYFRPNDPTDDPENKGKMVTRHYFDNWGHPVNTITMTADESTVLGVTTGKYTKNEGTNKKNNHLTDAASAGIQSINQLGNSDFEYTAGTDISGWQRYGASSHGASALRTESGGSTNVKPHNGNYLLKLYTYDASTADEIRAQPVYLNKNKTYVLSGYVNTACADSIASNGGAYLAFRSSANSPVELKASRKINYKTNPNYNKGWERLEVSFSPASSGKYQVAAIKSHIAQIAVFDDLQLEEVPNQWYDEDPTAQNSNREYAASNINLLQMSSFERPDIDTGVMTLGGTRNWWKYNTSEACHHDHNPDPDELKAHTGRFSMTFAPSVKNERRAYQIVPINASAKKTFILSGWGLTPPTNIGDGSDLEGNNTNKRRFFGMIAEITYQNSNLAKEYHYVSFNDDIGEWQFASGVIVPKKPEETISTIKVILATDYCVNRTYMDDISLVEEPVQTYEYDDKGDLVSATDSEGKTTVERDDNDRIKKYTALNGVQYNISYPNGDPNTQNPEKVTSDKVVTTKYYTAGLETYCTVKNTEDSLYLQSQASVLKPTDTQNSTRNFYTWIEDVNGVKTSFTYNDLKGLLTSSTAPSTATNRTIHYTYYEKNDRPISTYQEGVANLTNTYDDNGQLTQITRKTKRNGNWDYQAYNFSHDNWGQSTKITINDAAGGPETILASYGYDDQGRQTTLAYGYDLSNSVSSGDHIQYAYDLLDRPVHKVYYSNSNSVEGDYYYVYDGQGNLAKQYAMGSGSGHNEEYQFEYDSLGRLIRSRELNPNGSVKQKTEHLYDTANRLTSQRWVVGNNAFYETYSYNDPDNNSATPDDGTLASMRAATGDTLTYGYDSLKRVNQVSTKNASDAEIFYVAQSYDRFKDNSNAYTNRAKNRISAFSYRKPGGALIAGSTYSYDAVGNISQIGEMVGSTSRKQATYTYDAQNQLIQEVRYSYTGTGTTPSSTVTTNYTYDTAGNLLSSNSSNASTISYSYGDNSWKDRLTQINIGGISKKIAYEGQTYDAATNTVGNTAVSGNPINWFNGVLYTNLTWTQGRRLSSLNKGGSNISYTYDMDGIRSSKVVNGTTYNYVTQNGKVVREMVSSSSTNYTVDFIYDAEGDPFALIYTNANGTKTTFYYVLNAQGDVVQLINAYGQTKASYAYDAWGNILSQQSYDNSFPYLHSVNPLRYRGYYYDNETGWYYLQSRYYDPVVKRFLNADSFGSTGQGFLGYNMFAYCGNNPVIRADHDGNSYEATIGWTSTMWGLAVADGPLPIGDIIYFLGTVAIAIGDTINTIGVDNIVFYASNVPNQISDLVDRMSSNSGGSPSPRGPDFRKFTRSNFRYNLQQLTNEAGANMQAHHVLPQKLESFFNNAGINIHDPIYGSWVDSVEHSQWSYAYNQAWQHFFANYQNPSQGQILAYAKELADFFGFETLF